MSFQAQLHAGCQHLSDNDPVLKDLVAQHGPPDIKPHTDYYQTITTSIISQQLSVKAAATITGRFVDLFGHFPTPIDILTSDFDDLRSVGLSGQKTNYIIDLARHIEQGSVSFDSIDRQTNQQIISQLTAVKGIGEWTAQMFLMFSLGRLDVLAPGDLGIRNAVTKLYGFDQTATPSDVVDVATRHHWQPYQTIACWYLWRSLDNKPPSAETNKNTS